MSSDETNWKSVSIVIPNWNGRELLAEYFGSVVVASDYYRARTGAPVEIIVVDDASTDGGREWLRENYDEHDFVQITELGKNVGFLRAVNEGLWAAKHEVVLLLNNDVEIEQGCITPLVRHFAEENVFAVCCRADRIGTDRLDGGGKIGKFERGFWRVFLNYEAAPQDDLPELISFYGSGGYTAYDREKLKQLGGFQDCLAPIYWEDVEICYRAWKRGWTVRYEPESHVHHKGSATMGKKTPRREMAIVTERNRLLMTWINLHDTKWMASHCFRLTLKLLGSLFSLRWNYLRSFGRALSKISDVRRARSIEKGASIISDRELANKFIKLVRRPEIYVVKDHRAELEFAELKKKPAPRLIER